ncbi:RNA polymerase II degradation factor 1-like [Vanessa cardui]|uniref:RNA polymerase II degradation factor 1-like n=1 Tax=Vanessa cardui TaxID=171605 RepID=UPI001F130B0D|nr:RNA polymerase II degradation factor 1-like [Vanessa cardui]
MKELLMVVSLLLSGVVAEAPAPYPPSGWRPNGPAFELPEQRPQSLTPQKQQYLPPVDPRRPLPPNNFDDAVDVSVQGLPVPEQQPLFQLSPINGQQYTGPSINADVGRLNPSFQQAQYQQQLEKARQFARQREFEATRANIPSNGLPNQQSPRQFAFQTTSTTTTTQAPELKTPKAETTTESFDLNEGESLDDANDAKDQKQKVSVEVSKQNLQEYPAELFLQPLSQLNAQPQFISLAQLGQLRAPLYYQPEQVASVAPVAPAPQGFDGPAHLSALPSVLAQTQLSQQAVAQNQNFAQNPIIVQQEQAPLIQEPLNQYQPIINAYQPAQQAQAFPQYQQQPFIVQPQVLNQIQPNQFPQQQQPNQFAQPEQPNVFVQAQQPNQFLQPQQPNVFVQPQQPNQFLQPQQPGIFAQPQQPNQFVQPQQPNQFPQPQKPKDVEEIEQNDQQVVYQNYQPQFYQPQLPSNQYQNPEQPLFLAQPALNYQNQDQYYQNQFIPQQYDPSQYQLQPQQVFQDQNALQSGLDINQQGNGIDEEEESDQDEQEDEGSTATAVATAFGTRTQPRVVAQYGAPSAQGQTTTTESSVQETESEDAPAIAQATAVSSGRRNARFRSRRVRPIFTVDRSGHLVLEKNQ